MSKPQGLATHIFVVGVLLFPLILLSAFLIPFRYMSSILSLDALMISLANLVIVREQA